MTLPLVDSWNVRGIVGEKYTVGPRCSHPECERWADHAHHMVRRSQLKGDFNWVDTSALSARNTMTRSPAVSEDTRPRYD
jgi:hypothetical protein